MNIKKVIPSGYCKGVIRAINLVKETRLKYPNEQIYILGMIVHNSFITEALNNLNIITLDENIKSKSEWIEEIDEGIIIFTAHGISDTIKIRVIEKGLKYVDASCDDVIKTKNIVKSKLNEGYEILYIGKENHPEAMAILDLSKKIHLITNEDSIYELENFDKVFVTNQTTMSIFEINKLFEIIKNKYPNCVIQEEICNATSMRQKATLDIKDCDLLYIVGDVKSNNSNKLKEIALKNDIKKVYLIGSALDIEEEQLINVHNIYVTAGASTPTYLTNQVIDILNEFNITNKLKKPSIDYKKII